MIDLTVDGDRAVRISTPERLIFPRNSVTKLDVVRYFLSVGPGILAALRDRPTVLERWPAGVLPGGKRTVWQGEGGDGFFQRRLPRGAPPWVTSVRVADPNGAELNLMCPNQLAAVAWAANLGTLTFHPWPARRRHLDRPDELRVDLDPQTGTDFSDAVAVAAELRALLAELGLVGYPKTSGGRGLHVLVPIDPLWGWAEAHRALETLGRELVRRMPQQATVERLKRDRGARVYVDCAPQTIASAYSIRATPHARVSAPATWEEPSAIEPEDFDVTTMPARFAAVGHLHEGPSAAAGTIEPLLDLANRRDQGR